MTKKLFLISLIFTIFLSSFATTSAATTPPVSVVLDYNKINFDVQPRIINSRTMVPVRAIFESLEISIHWDGENRIITGTKDDIVIKMTVNNSTAYINDRPVKLDLPPKIIYGRTLVPLRFIAEATGAKVTWNNSLRQAGVYFNQIPPTDGNSPWNIENNASMVISNGYTYYSPFNEYIMKYKGDTYIKHFTSTGTANNLNVIGNYLFYLRIFNNNEIHRVNKDGTGDIAFQGTKGSSNLIVSDGYVYYINSYDNSIYRINMDGTGKKKLNNVKSGAVKIITRGGINVINGYIYYYGYYVGEAGIEYFGIYRMNMDGSNNICIKNKFQISNLILTGNAIYGLLPSGFIIRLNLDGTGYKELVVDEAFDLSLKGDRLYYINKSDGLKLYSVKTNGTDRYKVNDQKSSDLNIIGDYIYYKVRTEFDYVMESTKIPVNQPADIILVGENEEGEYLGVYAIQGDYVYEKIGIDGKMYRYNIDLRDMGIFYENDCRIVVQGDWIYYIADKIYKKRVDGTGGPTLVNSHEADVIKVIGDWIYFRIEHAILKVKKDGTNEQVLFYDENAHFSSFDVEGDYIYFSTFFYNETDKIYKIRTDGKDKKLVAEWDDIDWVGVNGDSIYVEISRIGNDTRLIKMSTDGEYKKDLFAWNNYNRISRYTFYQDKMYYVKSSSDGINWTSNFYSINLDGSGETKISEVPKNISIIDIIDNYYYYRDENNKLARRIIN